MGLEKPNLEIYKKVLSLENLEPSEVIFIDDTEKNLAPAQSLGLNTILFENDARLISELRKISL